MGSAISERVELAKLCASRDWSKAIRVLDSLLSRSCVIQDICNRAFCYSQLELHKHVIKDCDRALQLDPTLLCAYILKGCSFSALGRKRDALLVWEQGHEHAMHQCTDLKQLIELEELLMAAKEDMNGSCENHMGDTSRLSMSGCESVPHTNSKSGVTSEDHNKARPHVAINDSGFRTNGKSDETSEDNSLSRAFMPVRTNGKSDVISEDHKKASGETSLCSESRTELYKNSGDNLNASHNESSDKTKGNKKIDGQMNGVRDVPAKFNDAHHELSSKSKENNKLESQMNGAHLSPHKLSDKSESTNSSSDASCSTLSTVNNFIDSHETKGKPRNKNDMNGQTSDSDKKTKQFSVTRISKTKSISVDFRLSRGIAQVNEGRYAHAISIFDQILREDPTYPEALIGRGTAYAFQRELNNAIADFTKAIQSNPSAGEAWKRRGQARAALGESVEAIEDLSKALEFEPNSADILHERGIVNFKYKDFGAAVEDLTACLEFDKNNQSAYTYLGLALSSIGEYKRAEEEHLKAIQIDNTFLEAWAHLTQFYEDLANPVKAFDCLQQVLHIDDTFAKAYHLRGLLFHGMGEHRKAIKDLSTGLSIENANIECLYLRASCYHAIGEYGAAIKDYDAMLDIELDSMEKFVLQCLAFYQKEIALYTAAKVNNEFWWFDIDRDIDPLFKEYWCKRLHPKNVCEKVYRQPPLRESLRKGKLRKQDFALTKPKLVLLQASDSIGKKIQYDCPGFLPNRRQHRMAGLAAIEIAQKISKAWRSLHTEWKYSNIGSLKNSKKSRRRDRLNIPSLNRGGTGCSTSSSSGTSTSYGTIEDRSSGRTVISWQDVYSYAVKWRQISEPCDPVVWVHKLSEEVNAGFGSHTPMILGQAKVVRYYPNYEKTLDVAKAVIEDKKYVQNKANGIIDLSKDGKLQNIMNAKSCSDLYKVVGEDFWVSTWCNSTAFEGKRLEGTRITLAKMGESGFDFAIKTPCMPSRWDDFDAEMTMAWKTVCNACCGETYASTDFDSLENVREAILRMTYYWYNFMPLSRGNAVVGFVVMIGLLLAANMEFTGTIPQGLQVDWEAILNSDPDSFVDSMKNWMYPSLKVTTSWKDYPDVGSTLATVGSIVAALSSYDC